MNNEEHVIKELFKDKAVFVAGSNHCTAGFPTAIKNISTLEIGVKYIIETQELGTNFPQPPASNEFKTINKIAPGEAIDIGCEGIIQSFGKTVKVSFFIDSIISI